MTVALEGTQFTGGGVAFNSREATSQGPNLFLGIAATTPTPTPTPTPTYPTPDTDSDADSHTDADTNSDSDPHTDANSDTHASYFPCRSGRRLCSGWRLLERQLWHGNNAGG